MSESLEIESSPRKRRISLSEAQIAALWSRIAQRLRQGEALITPEHFQEAMEFEYQSLTGKAVTPPIRHFLRQMIAEVNARHPETYVAHGVQNAFKQAFGKGVIELQWDEAKVQSCGSRSIHRFSRRDAIRDLLDEVNVHPNQIDVIDCLKHSLELLRSQQKKVEFEAPSLVLLPVAPTPQTRIEKSMADPEVQIAIQLGDISPDEARERLGQQEKRRSVLQQQELEKVPQRLPSYVAQGIISSAQAEDLRNLYRVDQRLRKGEIDEAEADRIRNSILGGKAREALERPIREAVDQAVRYLQVFESMQKIGKECDDGLAFLIRHREVVVADNPPAPVLFQVLQELTDAPPLMQNLLELMDRKDHEIRMMSVRLPPYNYVSKRGIEKINNMTIELNFLDQLRHLSAAQISDRLHSLEKEVRVRIAADMRCLISLVDHVTKRTRFRKELRMLKLSQSIEEFYRSTSDLQEARRQAENFLQRRLRRLFKDMSTEEIAELRQAGGELIQLVEQRVVEERRAALEAQRLEAEGRRRQVPGEDEAEVELELTEEEKRMGVQIGRVEVRVAGSYRRVPHKIMPDPDDPNRFVIAMRDEETGELKPQLRRGEKRYVVRSRDGVWKPE